jgi:hypothetical protein
MREEGYYKPILARIKIDFNPNNFAFDKKCKVKDA